MTDRLLDDKALVHAASRITERAERQADDATLLKTYVETGVLPHLNNFSNQILYGRRGTGKTHVLKVLSESIAEASDTQAMYIEVFSPGSSGGGGDHEC